MNWVKTVRQTADERSPHRVLKSVTPPRPPSAPSLAPSQLSTTTGYAPHPDGAAARVENCGYDVHCGAARAGTWRSFRDNWLDE